MRILTFLTAVLLTCTPIAARADLVLVMVEQHGCHWCARWNEEIAPIYPKTPEGAAAPLVRRDISQQAPEGATFARRASFTPTFILLDDGMETARIEGYPGEDFFWGMLGQMIAQAQSD